MDTTFRLPGAEALSATLRIAEQLAELTAVRDRGGLDAALVSSLHELLQAEETAVHRLVGESGDRRWLPAVRLRAGDAAVEQAPPWTDPRLLPVHDLYPLRRACLEQREGIVVDGPPALTLLPLGHGEGEAVLELRTRAPLEAEQLRLAAGVLRVHGNCPALLDYGERDTLTGLLNRKTFEDGFLRSQFASPLPPGAAALRRGGHAVWLGVVDVDHFKAVNDCHGHLIGDEVLLLSRLMRATFRHGDQLYRFGGEEFVVLLRSDDPVAAGAAFERLRLAVVQHAFPRVGRISVSVGYTAVRPDDTPTSAFERADQACYVAKQSGRNRVESHAALVARGVLAEPEAGADVVLF